jgi:hypothetical protein
MQELQVQLKDNDRVSQFMKEANFLYFFDLIKLNDGRTSKIDWIIDVVRASE